MPRHKKPRRPSRKTLPMGMTREQMAFVLFKASGTTRHALCVLGQHLDDDVKENLDLAILIVTAFEVGANAHATKRYVESGAEIMTLARLVSQETGAHTVSDIASAFVTPDGDFHILRLGAPCGCESCPKCRKRPKN